MLVQFRQKYDEMAINWTGSVFGMIAAMDATPAPSEAMTVAGFIQVIIGRLNENDMRMVLLRGVLKGMRNWKDALKSSASIKNQVFKAAYFRTYRYHR